MNRTQLCRLEVTFYSKISILSSLFVMSITIEAEETFEDECYFLLRCFNRYLGEGPYEMPHKDRITVLTNIVSFNDQFRKHWWETIEDKWKNVHCAPKSNRALCNTLADPSCLVFLFEVYKATREWFQQEKNLSVDDHCSVCAYTMYSLVGHCIYYKKEPFITETLGNDRLTELALRVLMETDLPKRHAHFFETYAEVKDELVSWRPPDDLIK